MRNTWNDGRARCGGNGRKEEKTKGCEMCFHLLQFAPFAPEVSKTSVTCRVHSLLLSAFPPNQCSLYYTKHTIHHLVSAHHHLPRRLQDLYLRLSMFGLEQDHIFRCEPRLMHEWPQSWSEHSPPRRGSRAQCRCWSSVGSGLQESSSSPSSVLKDDCQSSVGLKVIVRLLMHLGTMYLEF